jgi:hypothetical protein
MSNGLHILAARVVERAVKAGATVDPVADFGDLALLDRLAREIEHPPIGEQLDLLDAPVIIDGVELRRLSWAAREWLATEAWGWWKDDPRQLDLAYAWAMAHARDKDALQLMRYSEPKARSTVTGWARGITANYEAIMAACAYLSPKATGAKAEDGEADDRSHIGPVLLTLLTEADQPLDYWIFEAPSELVEMTLGRIRENFIADRARMARAMGADVPPDPGAWSIKATKKFNDAAKAFVDRLTERGKAATVGLVKPAVSLAPVVDDGPGVEGGAQVDNGQGSEAVNKDPGGEEGTEKEGGGIVIPIGELGPSGDQQGSNPVVG